MRERDWQTIILCVYICVSYVYVCCIYIIYNGEGGSGGGTGQCAGDFFFAIIYTHVLSSLGITFGCPFVFSARGVLQALPFANTDVYMKRMPIVPTCACVTTTLCQQAACTCRQCCIHRCVDPWIAPHGLYCQDGRFWETCAIGGLSRC